MYSFNGYCHLVLHRVLGPLHTPRANPSFCSLPPLALARGVRTGGHGSRRRFICVSSPFAAAQPKERPRSAVLLADEATAAPMFPHRRSQQSASLSKSVSIQNIAGWVGMEREHSRHSGDSRVIIIPLGRKMLLILKKNVWDNGLAHNWVIPMSVRTPLSC